MRKIEMFENIVLKDGRDGAVVEIFEIDGEQVGFLVDIGSSPKDWDTIEVSPEDIAD